MARLVRVYGLTDQSLLVWRLVTGIMGRVGPQGLQMWCENATGEQKHARDHSLQDAANDRTFNNIKVIVSTMIVIVDSIKRLEATHACT
jgi:hypothetical protein